MNEDWLVKIEQYIDGSLPPDEQLLFESELKTNEELAGIFEIYRAFEVYHHGATQMPLTEEQRKKEEALKLTLKKMNAVYSPPEELIEAFRKPIVLLDKKAFEKHESEKPAATAQESIEDKKQEGVDYDRDEKNFHFFKLLPLKKWLPYAAAACLILFVSLYFFNSSSTPHQLATKYFNEHLTQVSQTMNASKDSLEKGIAAYNNKNYETALALFENFHRSHPEETEPLIYIGHVYLARKNYDSALKYFDQLSMMKGKYSSPGMFLKAVTLLIRNEQGDEAQAKELLEQVVIKKEEGSKTAEEWLKKW